VGELIGWLAEPWGSGFMQRALLAALLVGALGPLVGAWIVLRRLAYLTDAMSHATLGGVAVAYAAGASVTAGALVAGLAMAMAKGVLAAHPRLREEAVVGVAGVALFACGVILISRTDTAGADLTHFLFGSVTTVTWSDLVLDLVLGGAAAGSLVLVFSDLRAATFDPAHAALAGVPLSALRLVLFMALATVVVVALQSVGLLMTVAMVIVPAATARLWTQTVERMCALGSALGACSAVVGLTLAYHASSPPGATIALVAVAALAISFAITVPRRRPLPAGHVDGAWTQ